MKRLVFVTLTAFISFCYAEAQIEMNSSGNVGIGITPDATYQLKVGGGETLISSDEMDFTVDDDYIKFEHGDATSAIIFDDYSYEPTFRPDDNWEGYIGTPSYPFYAGYFEYLEVDEESVTSDGRLKENIRTLERPLGKIMNVRGVKYDRIYTPNPNWEESKKNKIEERAKDRIGFIAQELNEVYPELVNFDEANDKYSVNYNGMIPVLVEAIKEQQHEISVLQNQVTELLNQVPTLKSSFITSTEGLDQDITTSTLFQNAPNPFTEETTINYYLGDDVSSALIYIYDMTGKQLRGYELHHNDDGNVIINGGELDAGMYMYTMIADGIVIGSKQMILTE